MWVYRITGLEYRNVEFTRSLAQVSKIMEHSDNSPLTTDFPLDNASTVALAWKEAQRLWKQIGWDGTIAGEARSFMVPGASGFIFGFHVVTTDRRTFVASPCPLPHVQESLDWDAYTDSGESLRARHMIIDGEVEDEISIRPNVIKWTRSRRGNLTAFYENATLTVFEDNRNGGWKSVVSFGNLKVFTPNQRTEAEATAYVIEHYEKLKRELTPAPLDPSDPWSDD